MGQSGPDHKGGEGAAGSSSLLQCSSLCHSCSNWIISVIMLPAHRFSLSCSLQLSFSSSLAFSGRKQMTTPPKGRVVNPLNDTSRQQPKKDFQLPPGSQGHLSIVRATVWECILPSGSILGSQLLLQCLALSRRDSGSGQA